MEAKTHEVFVENQALSKQQKALTAEVRPLLHAFHRLAHFEKFFICALYSTVQVPLSSYLCFCMLYPLPF